jgi:hypothetical protein
MEEAHIDLEPGSEWRFELEADENVAVRVSAGPPADRPLIDSGSAHAARAARTNH